MLLILVKLLSCSISGKLKHYSDDLMHKLIMMPHLKTKKMYDVMTEKKSSIIKQHYIKISRKNASDTETYGKLNTLSLYFTYLAFP